MAALWKDVLGVELPRPFPRLTYAEAMGKYGSDKPDLRFELPLVDLTEAVAQHDGGGVPPAAGGGRRSRAASSRAGGCRPPGRARCRAPTSTSWRSSPRASARAAWRARASARAAPGRRAPMKTMTRRRCAATINEAAGARRRRPPVPAVRRARSWSTPCSAACACTWPTSSDLIPKGQWRFCWITDFPLFEQSDDGKLVAAHHPFTSPHRRRSRAARDAIPARCARAPTTSCSTATRSPAARSGSTSATCRRASSARSASPTRTRSAKFGFLLEAFKYGPPPHGGIAAGVDRLAMLLCGAESLRDVIAFPKTQKGTDLMTDAPGPRAATRSSTSCTSRSRNDPTTEPTTRAGRDARGHAGAARRRALRPPRRRRRRDRRRHRARRGAARPRGRAGRRRRLRRGTSTKSSKLIHGGLRYLQYGNFPLVFEGTNERALLMKRGAAPGAAARVPDEGILSRWLSALG